MISTNSDVIMHLKENAKIFKSFKILLHGGFSSTIETRRLISKLKTKENTLMQWHTQACNITTNTKVKIYLPYLNLT